MKYEIRKEWSRIYSKYRFYAYDDAGLHVGDGQDTVEACEENLREIVALMGKGAREVVKIVEIPEPEMPADGSMVVA